MDRKSVLSTWDLDINSLISLSTTLKAELSLHEFIKQAWSWIEGDKPYVDGYHIQIISEHLEALFYRQIRNLLINMPSRFSKSTLISVAFPAWCWTHNPSEQFLCSSYALSISLRDSRKCRSLIQSPWYQERWGNKFKILGDQNTKGRFENNKKGYRIATSSGGSATGEGGSILIADDPNNALDGESKALRERRIDWWNQVWSTRLNDKRKDCKVVVQQRVHEQDITGIILANDDLNEWTKLILPMEFKERRKSKTIILPSTGGKIWEDPRTVENQLLWPEKFDEEAVASLKANLGCEYAIAGQLQQDPSPEIGGLLKKDWFRWWKDRYLPDVQFIVQSWDTAFSSGKTSSYSACTTWGVFYDENDIENVILLSMWRGRVEYVELREMAKRLYFDYRDTGKIRNQQLKGSRLDLVLIEAKATGDPLIRDLNLAGIRAIPVDVKRNNDKAKRLLFTTPLIEGGRVWLPAKAPHFDRLISYADEFLESVACYPKNDSADLVDSMSQALTKLKTGLFLHTPGDLISRENAKSPQKLDIY